MAVSGSAALRATTAGLAVVGVLLAVLLWQSVDATLHARAEEARLEAERVDVLAVARAIESDRQRDPGAFDPAFRVLRAGGAFAVYAPDGSRIAALAVPGSEALVTELPLAAPKLPTADAIPARVPATGSRLLGLRFADGRTLVVAAAPRPVAAWGSTIAAYQALTLVIVFVGIAVLLRRVGRVARSRLESSPAAVAGAGDADAREAGFVVETFQSVIGELQHKGEQLELLRRRERERADRTERFSERVIAQMPTGLVVVDRAGRVTAANQSARELFAALPRGRTETVGYEDAFSDAPNLVAMVSECLEQGASFQRREIEMRAATGDTRVRCLGISVSPIAPPDAPPEAALCLMTNLTEVVDLRERVRLQDAMANLGEMAAGLTHELKNSLATIQGFAQLLAELAPDRATEPADALVEEIGHLSRMVTDFLNFARPHEVALVPVSIAGLLESILARFDERLGAARIALDLDVAREAGRACVAADEILLGRAFYNLIQNAVDALETVPGQRRIGVGVHLAGGDVVVEIRDNGPGIPREYAQKVFIPFFTTRSRGHGIGLALTQKIILSHGGRLVLESLDSGTVFRCVLPAVTEGRV